MIMLLLIVCSAGACRDVRVPVEPPSMGACAGAAPLVAHLAAEWQATHPDDRVRGWRCVLALPDRAL